MLIGSDMHAVRNLSPWTDSADALWESNAVPANPPPREAFSTSSSSSSFFADGNKAADPVVSGGSWLPLSLSSEKSTNPSFEGSPSARDSAISPLMQQDGDTNGDGVGTSGRCSSNDGPSSSSSITRSMEILHNISDKQTSSGNYSVWDHRPQGFHGWVDQGDRQRIQGDNRRMVNYGSKNYEQQDLRYQWNSYGAMCIGDPHFQLGHLRSPATMPIFVPPPPLQYNYGYMPNPGFRPQMHILPTQPHPDLSGGHRFVFPPAPLTAPPSMPFSLEGHKRVLIMKQIEFYFSSENLRTDFYLKSHMDKYGWVSIHLIAGFRRIKRLTDNISLILEALIPSVVVEVERNRVRKRFGWNEWVNKSPRSQNSTDSENKS